MNAKTIALIAIIAVIALGVLWYVLSDTDSQIAPEAESGNAPDLTADDSVFNEIEETADGLE